MLLTSPYLFKREYGMVYWYVYMVFMVWYGMACMYGTIHIPYTIQSQHYSCSCICMMYSIWHCKRAYIQHTHSKIFWTAKWVQSSVVLNMPAAIRKFLVWQLPSLADSSMCRMRAGLENGRMRQPKPKSSTKSGFRMHRVSKAKRRGLSPHLVPRAPEIVWN